jgi:hypothetical protein
METAYDWVTIAIFGGLVTLFLHRSTRADAGDDRLVHYLLPSVGCAAANWFGNEDWHAAAVALIAATLSYIWYFLRPARSAPPDA